MKLVLLGVILSCLFFVHGCSSSTSLGVDDAATTDEELTLSTCTTSIDEGAPDFFQTSNVLPLLLIPHL